jgi:hypothetical protein
VTMRQVHDGPVRGPCDRCVIGVEITDRFHGCGCGRR